MKIRVGKCLFQSRTGLLILFLSAATYTWGIPENKYDLSEIEQKRLFLREQWILNYVNFLGCILLASDWLKNNQLLSKLTHAHYRDTVPLIVKGHSDKHIIYLIWIFFKNKLEPAIIWKLVTFQWITSKTYSASMGRHLRTRYGQVILVSGYLVLTAVNRLQHWCSISFLLGSQKKLERVKVNIGFPMVRTDGLSGGRSVYGHVMTKFSGMGRFT